jgi:hypothetical protein
MKVSSDTVKLRMKMKNQKKMDAWKHSNVLRTTQALASSALLIGAACTAEARDSVISVGDPVSGAFYNEGSEVFPASNITDGLGGDTGSPYNWSFWLAPQGTLGSATINLEGSFDISSFNIQDTHNRGYFDRGTDAFDIAVSSDDVHFTTVLTGAFTADEWRELTTVNFPLTTPVVGQYVEFNVESLYGGASGGINELDVIGHSASGSGSVPDSGNVAFSLLGLIAVDYARRFRLARA